MEQIKTVVIVGGVAGGASAAARLRRLDENAKIILLEKGEYISFANCGLPYYIGGEITDKSALTLQTPQSFNARFNVDVRINSEAVSINSDKKTVTVKNHKTNESYEQGYTHLVLSPGAAPLKPPIDGLSSDLVFTLRNIPDTYKIKEYIQNHSPKTAIVAGGGYIGVEMAENLVNSGVAVTLIEMGDQVIAPLDYDMACDVHRHMALKGVRLMLSTKLLAVLQKEKGELKVSTSSGELQADMLILALGVKPETDFLKDSGILLNQKGGIVVNDSMQTNKDSIFAVGDAIEVVDFVTRQPAMIPLAGPANKQGRIAADQICGINSRFDGTQGSAILKVFDMTVATTGINEKTAKRLSIPYEKSFTYSASHASYYPDATNMSIKTLFDPTTGVILGAQITGFDGVDKRCDVFATALRAKMTAYDLTKLELCYAPPYSSAKDPVNMAGFVIENLLENRVKNFHWHDVLTLPRDGSVTLLDTRTSVEYENGHIEGFLNIPLDALRESLTKLDRKKPIYLTCQIGLRGYVAVRILTQNGFVAFNLSGGYRLYKSIFSPLPTVLPTKINKEINMNCCDTTNNVDNTTPTKTIKLDACGLQCPGPIMKLSSAIMAASVGDIIEISTTDPAFASDVEGYCRRTGNCFEGMTSQKGISTARLKKGNAKADCSLQKGGNAKNIIVFSGDLDKAIASFIIANASAAMGRRVTMFFTFWGLNVLRRPKKIKVKKDMLSAMFGKMMPRGADKLHLSNMNMLGMGSAMIKNVMKKKNVSSLSELIESAVKNGVELVACSMSMDVMGIKQEELIDGVKLGGAAAMIANAEESDMSLFI